MAKRKRAYSGNYTIKNPQKYLGNSKMIIYRSLWERRWMVQFDLNQRVLKWSSEEIIIPYKLTADGQIHRYFPDFYVEIIDSKGKLRKFIIEIKPKAQTVKPVKPKRITEAYRKECYTYQKNLDKWKAAQAYCKHKGYEFLIMTEDHLPKNNKKKK